MEPCAGSALLPAPNTTPSLPRLRYSPAQSSQDAAYRARRASLLIAARYFRDDNPLTSPL